MCACACEWVGACACAMDKLYGSMIMIFIDRSTTLEK